MPSISDPERRPFENAWLERGAAGVEAVLPELQDQADRLPPDPRARAKWLIDVTSATFDGIEMMVQGEIDGMPVRQKVSNPGTRFTTTAQLRVVLWEVLQNCLQDQSDAATCVRRIDGRKYALLFVPLISHHSSVGFGATCLAVVCPPQKSQLAKMLAQFESLVRACFNDWDETGETQREITPAKKVPGDASSNSQTLVLPQKVAARSDAANAASAANAANAAKPSAQQRPATGVSGKSPADRGRQPDPRKQPATAETQNSSPDAVAEHAQLAILKKASQFESHTELAYELANSIAKRFQCELVGVGIVRKGRVELAALSGQAMVKANTPGTLQVRQAMEESLDQKCPVSFPPIAAGPSTVANGVHRMWSGSTGDSNVYSIPLLDAAGVCSAIIAMRRPAANPLDQAALDQLTEVVKPFGSGMRLLMKASRNIWTHLREVVLEKQSVLWSSWMRALMTFAMALALGWFCVGTIYYRPVCTAAVSSGNIRHVTAPINGRLQEVFVKEGQKFQQGDQLLQFDTDKLQLQRKMLEAELGEVAVDLKMAVADREPKAIALKRAKLEVIRVKIAGLDRQIERATIVAEKDGTVSHHDLYKSIGQEYQFGEPLMELAIGSEWDTEIEVPDNVASYIATGQSGEFQPLGRPMDVIPFEIAAVSGLAEVRDGRNVFMANARLQDTRDWMRGGMKGSVQIKTEKRPVYWVLFRDTIDWLHAMLWF